MNLMTPAQLSEKGCVSRSLVYQLIRQGRLPAFRVGVNGKGKLLVRWEDWEAFLATCKVSEWPVTPPPASAPASSGSPAEPFSELNPDRLRRAWKG